MNKKLIRELKKAQELNEADLAKVVGGTQDPSSADWNVCPRCGGTLVPHEYNSKPYECTNVFHVGFYLKTFRKIRMIQGKSISKRILAFF